MSIINDALKKAEANLQKNSAQSPAPKTGQPKVFLLYILILAAGLFLANFIFGQLKNKATPKTNPPQKTAAPAAPAQLQTQITAIPLASRTPAAAKPTDYSSGPVLNGVFISDDGSSYALINNRIVKIGDEINGATIKQIKENSVELEKDGKISTLYNR